MKRFLQKYQFKYGRYAIQNLLLVISVGQLIVFFADMMTGMWASSVLCLAWPYVLQGQIWRLVTFIFVPQSSSILSMFLSVYFYTFIGRTIETEWGRFQFNVYYLIGMICNIVAAMFSGYGTAYYLNLSTFIAFAILYPQFELLLFYVIPISAKWIAVLDGLYILVDFIRIPILRASILMSMVPLVLFFWEDIYYAFRRLQYRLRNR